MVNADEVKVSQHEAAGHPNLHRLQSTHDVAAEVGEELERRQILQRSLPAEEVSAGGLWQVGVTDGSDLSKPIPFAHRREHRI